MSSLEIMGIVSAVVALGAFIMNQYKLVDTDNFWYDFANGISALGLLVYAYQTQALPFIITNTVWGIVSFMDVSRSILSEPRRSRRRRLAHRP